MERRTWISQVLAFVFAGRCGFAQDWRAAANRPNDRPESVDWSAATSRPLPSAALATPEYEEVLVPMGRWWGVNGGSPSVEHVVAHGCPRWVAERYRLLPGVLGQIHGGYHEPIGARTLRVKRVKPV